MKGREGEEMVNMHIAHIRRRYVHMYCTYLRSLHAMVLLKGEKLVDQ